jgi:hypothetical protein
MKEMAMMEHAVHVELTEDGVAHMIVSECGQIGIRSDRRQRLPKQIQLRFHARHQCCLNKLVEVICRDG